MKESGRLAYLKAMEIPVWVLRDREQADPAEILGVKLGPGSGQVLLLCNHVSETAGKLASDIARCLRAEPVWGWPAMDETAPALEEAVSEQLFTDILVFGSEVESAMFGGPAPELLGSAAVRRLPTISEIEGSHAARRSLWNALCNHGLAGVRKAGGRA